MTRTPEQKQALDTALKTGLSSSDSEMMRLALEKGADPDLLVSEASNRGYLKGVDASLLVLALKKGANPDLLLFGAIGGKALDIVKLAVEQGGANVNAACVPPGKNDHYTAAHWVYRNFDDGISSYLLGRGMQVDTPDTSGNTPLLAAVRDQDLAKTLHYLASGANPMAANARGEFALKMLQGQSLPTYSSDYSVFQRKRDDLLKAMLRNVSDEDGAAPAPAPAPGEAFNEVAIREDIAVGHPLELRPKADGSPAAGKDGAGDQGPPPNHGKGLHL